MTLHEDQPTRLHAIIHGHVQGVSFRATTEDKARHNALTGWVRNLPDGSVEVLAEGAHDHLQKLLAFLREGPPAAQVQSVDAAWAEATGEFDTFRIRR